MPLSIPDLDDRTFDQLADEARALIPRYFPAWTDYNLSDPGITLLEAFAFLFEASLYQINRVPERSLMNFAALLPATEETRLALLRGAVKSLSPATPTSPTSADTSRPLRATTLAEIESIACATPGVARARAILEVSNQSNVAPAETVIRILIVPTAAAMSSSDNTASLGDPRSDHPANADPAQNDADTQKKIVDLCAQVYAAVQPCCLITTRLTVSAAPLDKVFLALTVVREARTMVSREALADQIKEAIIAFFDPVTGGLDGQGWEFGRSVFRSELYRVLENVPGVEYVQELRLMSFQRFGANDIADPLQLASLLTRQNAATSEASATGYLWGRLLQSQQRALLLAGSTWPATPALIQALVDALNWLLDANPLYSKDGFAKTNLSAETKAALQDANASQTSQDPQTRRRNRLLLEDVFPQELIRTPQSADTLRDELPLSLPFALIAPPTGDNGSLSITVVDA